MTASGAAPDGPLVSVVIASVNGMPSIGECLEALTAQAGGIRYEVLVVDRCGEQTRGDIRRRFSQPEIHVIPVDICESIPKLRAIGMASAKGRLIAILEDHCNVPPGWFEAIERAHAAGYQAIGSGVENGSVERLIDWAVFFCEYSRFMPPVEKGVVSEIPGNCAVYDRVVLNRLSPELGEEVWESFLHQRLKEEGVAFFCDPAMTVSHKKEFGFRYFMSQRYHYSRSFAAMRMKAAPISRRLTYACATPALPFLLFGRMAKTIWRKQRRRKEFLLATPIIATFLASWAWGEAVGALLGPGQSLARVE
jgi:glycosyltransferase involved in cell wall biosynthesis